MYDSATHSNSKPFKRIVVHMYADRDLLLRLLSKLVPHGVQQCPIILQSQQLVGRGHVVGDGFFAVEEKGVGGPDVAGQQVIQR